MSRPAWYMVCYDITDPRRLGKVHRLMKKKAWLPRNPYFSFSLGNEKYIKSGPGVITELCLDRQGNI